MKLFDLLLETLSGDELYHYTTVAKLYNILSTNTLYLSTTIFQPADIFGGKKFFLSLSRTKSVDIGYAAEYYTANKNQRIVFDADKLNKNYSSIPVNYYRTGRLRKSEYEDRLTSDYNNISHIRDYIKRIEVLIHENDYNNIIDAENNYGGYDSGLQKYKRLYDLAKQKYVKIFFYSNSKDMFLQRNNINDLINQIVVNDKSEFNANEYNGAGAASFVTLLLIDKKLWNDDLIISDESWNNMTNIVNDFINKTHLSKYVTSEEIINKMYMLAKSIDNLNSFRTYVSDLSYDMSKFYDSPQGGPLRKIFYLLGKQMKRYKSNNIFELLNKKLELNEKPKLKKLNDLKLYKIIKSQDSFKIKLPELKEINLFDKVKNMNLKNIKNQNLINFVNTNNPTILDLIKQYVLLYPDYSAPGDIENWINNSSSDENVAYKVTN